MKWLRLIIDKSRQAARDRHRRRNVSSAELAEGDRHQRRGGYYWLWLTPEEWAYGRGGRPDEDPGVPVSECGWCFRRIFRPKLGDKCPKCGAIYVKRHRYIDPQETPHG